MSQKEPIVKYVSFFSSYKEAIDILPDDEQKLAAYEMIVNFGLYGIEPDYDLIPYNLRLLFTTIRANIEASVKNIQNGSKGGRPKKEETPVKTPLKTPVNTKKEKEKKKEKEMENIPFTSSLKGETLPPPADAGGASPFTLTDCQECADEGKVNLSESGIVAFYNRMEKDGWKIKGNPVTNLLMAMRGFSKNHKRYQKQNTEYSPERAYEPEPEHQEPQSEQKPKHREPREQMPDTNDKAAQLEWLKKRYGENVLEECGISEEEFYNEQN